MLNNKNEIKRRGLLLVLSSPSGAGKSTLSKLLLEKDDEIYLSVSTTTRPPRPGEVEGRDYHFVSQSDFDQLVNENGFLEHATVFDHSYGTPAAPVEQMIRSGKDVMFDIDWQGTQQLHEKVGSDLVRVFILPPSKAELEKRLKTRAQDTDEVVAKRMAKANAEISHWAEYDYVIINDDLEKAEAELFTILRAERMKRVRQSGLASFVSDLTKE
ncbi:MAG: guanylate kinase [Alphaproteobacteria bacterium]|nr:guanylate kinase [Alphaproteobacteria bacterium]HPF46156.1 guanylate kinase [Emcibacteraceae bacterium]